jgi:hypothetical protein
LAELAPIRAIGSLVTLSYENLWPKALVTMARGLSKDSGQENQGVCGVISDMMRFAIAKKYAPCLSFL